MEVLNTLGHGLNEKVYENALVVECRLRKIPFDQQPRFPVDYKGCRVGEFIPDLILHKNIIVDTKTIDRITDQRMSNVIEVHVNHLRSKLGKTAIETKRGQGYRFRFERAASAPPG